jgi:hypothetical protein
MPDTDTAADALHLEAHHRSWDFGLTVATVALLGSLGLQSFAGTLYSWWALRMVPGWEQTGYLGFVSVMNAIAAPQVVALVVVMGLCVPKRLFSRQVLLLVSALMVVAGAAAGLLRGSLSTGLAVYLTLAALIQVAVVVLTVAGARSPSYLTQGRLTKVGSGLLHLGFIVFGFVVVELQHSRLMMPVFDAAAVLVAAGTALSFYADKLAFHRRVSLGDTGGDAGPIGP